MMELKDKAVKDLKDAIKNQEEEAKRDILPKENPKVQEYRSLAQEFYKRCSKEHINGVYLKRGNG